MDDPDFPAIYRLVTQSFKDLGVSDPSTFNHSILLHSRSFAGEKFECEGILALLLRDGNRLVFFGRNGEILKRVRVNEDAPEVPQRPSSRRIPATDVKGFRVPVSSPERLCHSGASVSPVA